MPKSRYKYANHVTGLNVSVPIELKLAIEQKTPVGLSVSEFVTEILARHLGVEIQRAEAGTS